MTTTKKILALIACLLFVLAFASTGIFASDLTGYFTNGYGQEAVTSITYFDNGFSVAPLNNTPNDVRAKLSADFYSISGSVSFELQNVSTVSNKKVFSRWTDSGSTASFSNLVNCHLSDDSTTLYVDYNCSTGSFDFEITNTTLRNVEFWSSNSSSFPNSTSWTFSSLTVDGVDLITATPISEVIPVSLSPGYALIIQGPCEVSERTFSIQTSWNFDKLVDARINGTFERTVQTPNIRDGFSPDRGLTVEQLLPWWADNTNIFGVASNYSYHNTGVFSLSDTGINYVLGYPLFYQGSGDYSVLNENAVNLNGSILISYYGDRPTISKIALECLPEIVDGHYHYYNVFRPDVYDEDGQVVSDGQGGVVVNFPDSPVNGGNNGQPSVNDDNSLLGTISKLVNDIKGLFSNAVQGITELVNTGSSFMQSIGAMFSWLPSPVLSIIIAAFTVLLVVGVLKVLWR